MCQLIPSSEWNDQFRLRTHSVLELLNHLDSQRPESDRIEIHAFISYREMAISHTRLTTNNLSSCTPILLK